MLSFKDIAKIFEEIEVRLCAALKRCLKKHKQLESREGFEWSAWQAEKLHALEQFRRENRAVMDDYTDLIDTQTRELMQEQFAEGERLAEQETAQTQQQISEAPPVSSSGSVHFFGVNEAKMESLMQDITEIEQRAETAALRTMDDVYRQTLNRVQLAQAVGEMPLEKAIDEAVRDFLEQGIKCIVYRDGRRVNIADYVRMALRTTSARAALQGRAKRFAELGYDTVLISQYGACSKTCEPWQGRVYIDDVFTVWQGESDGVRGKSNYCGEWFTLLSHAISGGLFHPNCRHTMGQYIHGVTQLPEPIPAEQIKRERELEQKQRAMERNIRRLKRLEAGTLDPAAAKEYRRKLNAAERELGDFVNANRDVLRREFEREKAYTEGVEIPTEKGVSGKIASATSENAVDLKYINSDEYKKKFDGITGDPKVDKQLHSQAVAQLTHRNGTYGEDLTLINAETGNIEGRQSKSVSENGVEYNSSLNKALADNPPYSLISIHNHPTNNPPTGSDLVSNAGRKYRLGVVVTHNGRVFTYKAGNKPFLANSFDSVVDKNRSKGYNEYEAILETLKQYQRDYGIEWSER